MGETMKNAIIDLDGVVCDFTNAFVDVCERISGKVVEGARDTQVWDWIKPAFGPEVNKAAWNYVLKEAPERFWMSLKVLDLEAMNRIAHAQRNQKCNFYFVTTRPFEGAEFLSERWLSYYIPYPKVIQTPNKGKLAAGLDGVEWAIDDKAENCLDILKAMGTKTKVYVKQAPYNKHVWDEKYLLPVKSLAEALEREGL